MQRISKIFICAISILGAGFAHAAAPADSPLNRKRLAAEVQDDLKQLHDLLAKMMALPKDSLNEHLKHFKADSLSSLKHAIGECTFSTGYVHQEYLKSHPVGVCKPCAQAGCAAQAHHKHGDEQRKAASASQVTGAAKPRVAVQQPQAVQPLKLMTGLEEGNTFGTATQNLMATSPKFKMGIEIGSLAKKLVSMTAEKQRLEAYKTLSRKITMQEDSILRHFQNASEQKLEKFVNFLRVLIDDSKLLNEFHMQFHVGSVVSNVGNAAQEMSEEQLKLLHALLTQLAK